MWSNDPLIIIIIHLKLLRWMFMREKSDGCINVFPNRLGFLNTFNYLCVLKPRDVWQEQDAKKNTQKKPKTTATLCKETLFRVRGLVMW